MEKTFNYATHIFHGWGDRTPFPGGVRFETEEFYWVDGKQASLDSAPQLVRSLLRKGVCDYCGSALDHQIRRVPPQRYGAKGSIEGDAIGHFCGRCNWWMIQLETSEDQDEPDECVHLVTSYEGVVAKFDHDFWRESMQCLQGELSEYRRRLSTLTPYEVEATVARLLSQFHGCEAKLVGRSHDHGIDLILVLGNEPIAVQVKHRSRKRRTEGVEVAREFVGALVGEGYESGILVSTAEEFTAASKVYCKRVRQYCPVNLVSLADIKDMLEAVRGEQQPAYANRWSAIGRGVKLLDVEPAP